MQFGTQCCNVVSIQNPQAIATTAAEALQFTYIGRQISGNSSATSADALQDFQSSVSITTEAMSRAIFVGPAGTIRPITVAVPLARLHSRASFPAASKQRRT